jgi:hypothetical protein
MDFLSPKFPVLTKVFTNDGGSWINVIACWLSFDSDARVLSSADMVVLWLAK